MNGILYLPPNQIPVTQIVESEVPKYLLRLHADPYSQNRDCLNEVTSSTISICMSKPEDVMKLISLGYLDTLTALLMDKNVVLGDSMMNIAWSLANISGADLKLRDLLLTHNVLPEFITRLDSDSYSIKVERGVLWFFSNMVRGAPYPDHKYSKVLVEKGNLIFSKYYLDDQVFSEGVWLYCEYLEPLEERSDRIKRFLSFNQLSNLVTKLDAQNIATVSGIVRILNILVAEGQDMCTTLVNMNLVAYLKSLVSKTSPTISSYSLSILATMLQYSESIDSCIKHQLIDAFKLILVQWDIGRKEQVCRCLVQLFNNISIDQFQRMFMHHPDVSNLDELVIPLLNCLDDPETIGLCREALRAISAGMDAGKLVQETTGG